MKTPNYIIKLLIKNMTDKQLLANYLHELGYETSESLSEPWANFSLIITDEFHARQFGRNLLLVKSQPGIIFFPIVILLPQSANGAVWIDAGYDEVLRFPLRKIELAVRLKSLLHLRAEVEIRYQLIFETLQIGIYWMSSNNRILMANHAFMNILEYQLPDQIKNKNLSELGVRFQNNRETFLTTLKRTGKITGYESFWILNSNKKVFIRENVNVFHDENTDEYYYIGTIENVSTITVGGVEHG